MSWFQSLTECIQSGAMLTSVEDPIESNFLVEHADLYASRTSGFWIGIYRNANGQLVWQDNSALDFVNWDEGQPLEDQLEHCVELSAVSGYWSIIPCSSTKGFICKTPKNAPKDKAHSQENMWIVITLVLIILLGMGFTIYYLFKLKSQSETERDMRWESTLVKYSRALTKRHDGNDCINTKEKVEHNV
ncbi:MRC1 protein, partial [Upupa epops]|nr:MRC1 protein [Upupa epops]